MLLLTNEAVLVLMVVTSTCRDFVRKHIVLITSRMLHTLCGNNGECRHVLAVQPSYRERAGLVEHASVSSIAVLLRKRSRLDSVSHKVCDDVV
jgi:hypothetical protein